MKPGKGGGKGKRKGKGGKGGERQQVRRELASVVGEVLRGGGVAEGPGAGKGAGKGKRKGGGAGPWAPSRRAQRKSKRQERKERRSHYYAGGRRKAVEGPEPAEKARRPAEGGAAKPGAAKQKRRRAVEEDDDDEIASSEAEGPGSGGRRGKARKGKNGEAEDDEDPDSELGASGEEGEDAEEEAEEEEVDDDAEELAGNSEEEEEGEGRLARRAAAGDSAGGGVYAPPHLRGAVGARGAAASKAAAAAAEQLRRRQLRGLMNRVSEGNLDPSAQELAKVLGEMLPEVGSTSAADAFLAVLLPAAVGDPGGSVLVLGCHAALAVTAHLLFGAAFGAAALLQAGEWLRRRLPLAEESGEATGEDARVAKNCVVFVCLMFSFGLLPGSAIFDLARYIFASVSELRIELALTLLRYAGRSLRADCAEDFREVLRFVNDTASSSQAALAAGQEPSDMRTRVDFLLRELSDLKNNKTSFAAMDRFEHVRSWLRSSTLVAAKKVADHQLAVPFRFMQDAPPVGWPLGGAAAAAGPRIVGRGTAAAKSAQDPLRAVAQAQRLTTELRQSLFVALMGAEDFEHASERLALVAASAKAGPDEACLILFHCAVREKVPNPFYEHVASALCARPQPWGRRFAHCLKRAAVQNLQQAHAFGLRATVGLAELVAALVAAPSVKVPLAVLRFVKFGEAAPGGGPPGGVLGLLLRHLSESLLRRAVDAEAAAEAFGALRRYDDVREGMLLVLDGLVRPRLPGRAQAPELHQKLKVVRQELAKGPVEKPAKAAKASPRFL